MHRAAGRRPPVIWRLRDIEIDAVRFELRRAGRRIAIAPKPLKLLLHLAQRHPASVTPDELLKMLWPDVRVTPSSVARAVRDIRRAIGDSGATGLIRTVRGRGYALSDAPEPAATIAAGGHDAATFIGREAELACLRDALGRVESGGGCIATIGGEPGIGKTSLATELVSRAAERGFRVVMGNCRSDPRAPAYRPWPEVVDGIVEQCGDDVWRALGATAGGIAPVAAHLRDQFTSRKAASMDVGARFRLFQGTTKLLRDVARSRPLLVLLEDLHWARAAAIHLLQFLSRAIVDVPLLLVATHRTAGAPRNATLQAALGELASLPHALCDIRLAGLPLADLVTYVHGATGTSLESPLVERLHAATGGNPRFVRRMIPIINANGAREGIRRIPASLKHVLREQLRRSSRSTRRLVEFAAVIGTEASLLLLV